MPSKRAKSRPAARPATAIAAPPAAAGASRWIVPGLLILTAIVFAQVRDFSFVNWDDPQYITANPNIIGGLTLHNVWWAFSTGYPPYWHPLTWLSHLTDVQLFGFDAGWHHLTNVVIHAASVVALFEVVRRMTGALWPSAFVAAVFAVHPLHVESVAWVTERKDVLSTLCVWLTMAAYLRYVRRPGPGTYVWAVVAFALALMAKPMVVTLPVVLLLLDVWPLKRLTFDRKDSGRWRALAIEKLPLIVLAIGTSIVTVIVQQKVGATPGFDVLPWHIRVANALVACVRYLGDALWPTHLAAFYPYPRAFPASTVIGAVILLLAITAAALVQRRDRPYLLVGWLWFLVTLSPVLGFLQAGEQAMADRFMYVPLVGLTIVAAWGARDAAAARPAARPVLAAAGGAAIVTCAVLAFAQTATWRDDVTLWSHAVAVTPDNYLAEEKLGEARRDRGDLDGALAHYSRALNLGHGGDKYYAVVQNDLGLVLMQQGHAGDALTHFLEAVRLDPSFAQAQTNLGNSLAASGRPADAAPHYQAAIRLDPSAVEAHVGLGGVLLQEGRADAAQAPFAAALALNPSLAEAHNGLGSALAMQNKLDDARAQYVEAIRLKPDLATAHFNLAVIYLKQGKNDDGRRELQVALAIDPGYGPARQLLASIQ